MVKEFIERFDLMKPTLQSSFAAKHPSNYQEIVRAVIEAIADPEDAYGNPDPSRIHEIDDGDYQGTLLYLIAATGYQPSDYWFVKVGYGSCSGCDTLQAISGYSSELPTDEQVNDYMTLALHIVQGLKKLDEEKV